MYKKLFVVVLNLVIDLEQRKVIATWKDSGKPEWIGMSPSGTYVIAQWTGTSETRRDTRIYDRNLQYLRTAFSGYTHSDFAIDGSGDEVMVYDANSGAQLAEIGNPSGYNLVTTRLSDAKKTLRKRLLGGASCNRFVRRNSGRVLLHMGRFVQALRLVSSSGCMVVPVRQTMRPRT